MFVTGVQTCALPILITNTVKRMSEGELLQISKTRKLDIDEETYFRIISDKTASLLSTCCEIGARASTDDGEKITALKEFGENLGIAFQIRDDILDFIGTKNIFGKSPGADIKEKKITLPLIYALKNAPQEESKKIINLLKSKERKTKVDVVIKFVKMYEGIEYSEKVALEYSKAALSKLEQFQISESRLSLESLVSFVVERKN
jgi:octaprenyl-diphosphate synthase